MNDIQSIFREGDLIQGQYRVIKLLGQGTSGAVYLVADEREQQKQMVLKEVMYAVHEEQRDLPFDAATLKHLDYPGLPRIYKVFQGDKRDRFYILMEYVEGHNLEVMRHLMPGKRFSLHAAMMMMSPIMDAISYLHRQNPPLIHGDIKPSNIILPGAGSSISAKLVDFGGSRNVSVDSTSQENTLNFHAPEQFGKKTSRRTDVYALGAIFYTLLTGKIPVEASYRLERIKLGEPDPLLSVDQLMPSAQIVAEAIDGAMALNRNDRFASVGQFREALWQVIHTENMVAEIPHFTITPPIGEKIRRSDVNPEAEQASEQVAPDPEATQLAKRRDLSFPKVEIPGLIARGTGEGEMPSISSQEVFPTLRRKKRRKRKILGLSPLIAALLLVCLIGSGIATAAYGTYSAVYQSDYAQARVGLRHLDLGASLLQTWTKKPFDAAPVVRAQNEFKAASAVFVQLNSDAQSLPAAGTIIPGLGTRLNIALHLLPAAMEISSAGVIGCDALYVLISRFREPLSVGNGFTTTDIAKIGIDFHQVEGNVNLVAKQVNALQPGDLQFDASLARIFAAFHRYLPSLQALLHEIDQLLPALPQLLGIGITSAFYLVEILDTTELRPGGGLIKDYGFATLIGGRLSSAKISDANLLDTQFVNNGGTLPLPAAYRWFSNSWNLRDSNLDADFPTAAGYAEQNYIHEHGRIPLQGVIAITPNLMANALAITGPIAIPELNQTVNTHNLVSLIQYYQFGPGSHTQSSNILSPYGNAPSRYFTQQLAAHFLERIRHLPASAFPQLIQLLNNSLHTKDLQIYFNNPAAENLLRFYDVGATIQPSAGDNLFVVDANISGNHVNPLLTRTVSDQVTIDGSGNATHRATLRYAWLRNGKVFGPPVYSDYVRIYTPLGSSLQRQQGWQPQGSSVGFGRQVWAGSFNLSFGQTNIITLTWIDRGIAKRGTAGWQYQYLVQHQAGASWKLNVQISVPSCQVRMVSGGLRLQNGQTAGLSQYLYKDINLAMDYRC